MLPCSDLLKDQCIGKIKCKNGNCVSPKQLCNGIDECGDWSDEIGCPSHCGNEADHFERKGTLVGTTQALTLKCLFRIHAPAGSSIAIIINSLTTSKIRTDKREVNIFNSMISEQKLLIILASYIRSIPK